MSSHKFLIAVLGTLSCCKRCALTQKTSGFIGSSLHADAPSVFALINQSTNVRQPASGPKRAVAVLTGSAAVRGVVIFDQAHPGMPVKISGNITGLEANSLHGFHIHTNGDLRSGCLSTGSHFNPENETHGAPNDMMRHVGDLGNVLADAVGIVKISLVDTVITLGGQDCVVGRSVVLHEKVDDLGLGATSDSKTTGNAGGRLACGVIGFATPV